MLFHVQYLYEPSDAVLCCPVLFGDLDGPFHIPGIALHIVI